MKRKIIAACLLFALALPGAWGQAWYTGDGGRDIRLTVGLPAGKNLAKADGWLTEFVQGSLIGDFQKYSAMTVIDRQNLDKIIEEQKLSESGFYEEKNYAQVGQLTNAQYILSGSITKQPKGGFSLQLGIADVEKGTRRASFNKICTEEALNNATVLKEAAFELLAQMGVNLTEEGKKALSGGAAPAALSAETALSKALSAQKNGTVVEALSYFYQAVSYDPSQAEAASRLNVLSANISSGNMGEDARNDIQWRKNWVARLEECERYFANYMKAPLPYTLVYQADLEQGAIDYEKKTLEISGVTLSISPDFSWVRVPQNVVNKVREGLTATGRTEEWGLDSWPQKSVGRTSPFTSKKDPQTVVVQLLNDKGRVIGSRNIELSFGRTIEFLESGELRAGTLFGWENNVVFTGVRAADITDKLNITIASINGENAQTVSKNKRISIMPLAEYDAKKGGYRVGDPGPAGGYIVGRLGGVWYEAAPEWSERELSWGWRGGEIKMYCLSLDIGGYTDWSLPNAEALNLMYTNLKRKGLGNFKGAEYWFSLEGATNRLGWVQSFGDGYQRTNYWNVSYYVRAVRAF
jgi:hypothetical protein